MDKDKLRILFMEKNRKKKRGSDPSYGTGQIIVPIFQVKLMDVYYTSTPCCCFQSEAHQSMH